MHALIYWLLHWPQGKMADILQQAFPNAFSSMKTFFKYFEKWLKIVPWDQLTMTRHGVRDCRCPVHKALSESMFTAWLNWELNRSMTVHYNRNGDAVRMIALVVMGRWSLPSMHLVMGGAVILATYLFKRLYRNVFVFTLYIVLGTAVLPVFYVYIYSHACFACVFVLICV